MSNLIRFQIVAGAVEVPPEHAQTYQESGVYHLICLANGMTYVGSTKVGFKKRFYHHVWHLKKDSHFHPDIQADWNTFGERAFALEIVEVTPPGRAKEAERRHLSEVKVGPESGLYNRDDLRGQRVVKPGRVRTIREMVQEAKTLIDEALAHPRRFSGCITLPDQPPGSNYLIVPGQYLGMSCSTLGMHRYALIQKLQRPLRPGFFACHLCDVRACFNPHHVYEGTPQNNVADIVAARRRRNA